MDNSDIPGYDGDMDAARASDEPFEAILAYRLEVLKRRMDTVTIKFLPYPGIRPLPIESRASHWKMTEIDPENLDDAPVSVLGNAMVKKLSFIDLVVNNNGVPIIRNVATDMTRVDDSNAPDGFNMHNHVATNSVLQDPQNPIPNDPSGEVSAPTFLNPQHMQKIYSPLPSEWPVDDRVPTLPFPYVLPTPIITPFEQAAYFYNMEEQPRNPPVILIPDDDDDGSNRVGCKIGEEDDLERALRRLNHMWCPPNDNSNNCFYLCLYESLKNQLNADPKATAQVARQIEENEGKDDNGLTNFASAQILSDLTGDIFHIYEIVRIAEDKKSFAQSVYFV